MKLILALLFSAIWTTLGTCGPVKSDNIETWQQFKEYFNKKYSSVEEESERKINFENALKFVRENQGRNGLQLGINEFSDLSDSEFFAKNSPLSQANQSKMFDSIQVDDQSIDEYEALPVHFDWREHIPFNPIEQQGHCGACWAFATVLTVEAAYAIHRRAQVHLSKQELVDCSLKTYNAHYINQGCTMGYTTEAYKYMKEHGVYEEVYYPYKAVGTEACYLTKISGHNLFKINDYRRLAFNGTDQAMMNIVKTVGPIVVNINDQDPLFKHYKTGILNVMPHMTKTTHSVTLIGWGREGTTDYWIIRNSWGASWGDAGHARIGRHQNLMGINNHPVYPIV